MALLLNLRVLVALVLAALLAFSHFTVYRKGRHDVQIQWDAAKAQATIEARSLEQQRQRRADEAARIAAAREAGFRAAAAAARRDADGLRDDIGAAGLYAAQSRAAAERVAGLATELLEQCTRSYLDVAEAADRADNEARELRQAWPK